MISRSDVVEAFRTMLGREPESDLVIEHFVELSDIAELYRTLLESDEFRQTFPMREMHLPAIALPMHHPKLPPSSLDASRLAGVLEQGIFETKGFEHDAETTTMLSFFDAVQREAGIVGSTGEIGVAHGAFFVPLVLCCRGDEIAVAIDVFDQRELNWDTRGGASSLSEIKKIVVGVAGNDDNVRYIQGDSFFLSPQAVRSATGGSGFRLFSIDGAHSAHHTVNDLKIAGEILDEGGIAFLDDIANWGWPGVITGFARYMLLNDHQRLVPFFLCGNKLLLTTPNHQEYYLRKTIELQSFYDRLPTEDYEIGDFFGFRVLGWP